MLGEIRKNMTNDISTKKNNNIPQETTTSGKNPYKPPQIISKKQFLTIFIVLILLAAVLLAFAFTNGIFNENNESNGDNTKPKNNIEPKKNQSENNTEEEFTPPSIIFSTTASSVKAKEYNSTNQFLKGDNIYVYFIVPNERYNYSFNIAVDVLHKGKIKHSYETEYFDSLYFNESIPLSTHFETNETWKSGSYNISLNLKDKISNLTTNDYIEFVLHNSTENIPKVSISANETNGYAPFDVMFNCCFENLTGDVIFVWDFDDGDTSNSQNTSHIFSNSGAHKVTLTATGENQNSVSANILINVYDTPSVILYTSNRSGHVGENGFDVYFELETDNFVLPPDLKWNFNGDQNFEYEDNNKSKNWTYTEVGIYNFSVIVSHKNWEHTLSCQIEVFENLNIDIVIEKNCTEICYDGLVSGGIGDYIYSWEFTNVSSGLVLYESNEKNGCHNFAKNQLIRIGLTVTDEIGSVEEIEFKNTYC